MIERNLSVCDEVRHKISGDMGVIRRVSESGFASVKYTSGSYSGKLVGVRVSFFELINSGSNE